MLLESCDVGVASLRHAELVEYVAGRCEAVVVASVVQVEAAGVERGSRLQVVGEAPQDLFVFQMRVGVLEWQVVSGAAEDGAFVQGLAG